MIWRRGRPLALISICAGYLCGQRPGKRNTPQPKLPDLNCLLDQAFDLAYGTVEARTHCHDLSSPLFGPVAQVPEGSRQRAGYTEDNLHRRQNSRVFYNAQTEVKDELEGWEVEFSLQDGRPAAPSRRERKRRAASRCRTSDKRPELRNRASG